MTLQEIVSKVPSGDAVTVVRYIDGEILVDAKLAGSIIYNARFIKELANMKVRKISVGEGHEPVLVLQVHED